MGRRRGIGRRGPNSLPVSTETAARCSQGILEATPRFQRLRPRLPETAGEISSSATAARGSSASPASSSARLTPIRRVRFRGDGRHPAPPRIEHLDLADQRAGAEGQLAGPAVRPEPCPPSRASSCRTIAARHHRLSGRVPHLVAAEQDLVEQLAGKEREELGSPSTARSARRGRAAARPRRSGRTRRGRGRANGRRPSTSARRARRSASAPSTSGVSRTSTNRLGARRRCDRRTDRRALSAPGEHADAVATALVEHPAHPGAAVERDEHERRPQRDGHERIGGHPVHLLAHACRQHGDPVAASPACGGTRSAVTIEVADVDRSLTGDVVESGVSEALSLRARTRRQDEVELLGGGVSCSWGILPTQVSRATGSLSSVWRRGSTVRSGERTKSRGIGALELGREGPVCSSSAGGRAARPPGRRIEKPGPACDDAGEGALLSLTGEAMAARPSSRSSRASPYPLSLRTARAPLRARRGRIVGEGYAVTAPSEARLAEGKHHLRPRSRGPRWPAQLSDALHERGAAREVTVTASFLPGPKRGRLVGLPDERL